MQLRLVSAFAPFIFGIFHYNSISFQKRFGKYLEDLDDIERVHTIAIKRFLKVSVHTSNSIVYGETGRVSLYINLAISSINYWLKLLKKPDSCLSKQAYLMRVKICEPSKDNWVTKTKNILCRHDA